ncbi:response regulator transcription factor [Pedobacter sp. JY14-1]|uniref:response regulator transcription factor n=1 Tax=Pedobacter sp. JY14-1 TaxID=3034151 RepID=UPI0023E270E2|nr:response regulator transcription factor [Pedobacter sp. JY14-1]
MKVLLVEDEPGLVSVIVKGLKEVGIETSVAVDGNMGLDMALGHQFDLLILDIMLPGMNGIQLCREVRKVNPEVPVIMLTALNTTENIVTGLDAGADDYLAKPFKFPELEARIRSAIRRSKNGGTAVNLMKAADLEVNLDTQTVTRADRQVTLTTTEYKLLLYFIKNRNRVLSRIQILENVWDIDFNMGTNVVDVYVNYLRRKLDTGYAVKLIHTVFGSGYIFREQD